MDPDGGPSTRELIELLREIFTRLADRSPDVMQVLPPLGHIDIASFTAAKIIIGVFG